MVMLCLPRQMSLSTVICAARRTASAAAPDARYERKERP